MATADQNQNQHQARSFGISSFAIRNKTSVFVLTFIVLFMGITAYRSMPKESFPEITQPTIYIGTMYRGNSPVDIENLITRPIEKEIKGISGIDNISSTSVQDYSTIIVEFNLDEDVKDALQEVKDAVDKAKQELPSDLDEEPDVFELDFSEIPIMFVNLYGDMEPEPLRKYAEYLEDEIEEVDEISSVDLRGVRDREVYINCDPSKMAVREVSFNDIAGTVGSENLNMFAGDLLVDGYRRNMRMEGEIKDPKKLESLVIKHDNGGPVYLSDVATVTFDYEEPKSFARLNGDPVVILEVKKKSGGNLLDAAAEINAIIDSAKANVLPKELNVIITNDQSGQTQDMVDSLENNIISGVILVVLVLLFFLGLRNSIFVGIAIPLSMLMGIAVLNATGNTLNMMVLFSLILALGMLVDNGIVVVENVYRHMSMGKDGDTAASNGVGEVAWPIIASTATTLAAFLPLLFWNDLMGEFFKFLPITLMIVLSCSLFVALVVNPVLTAVYMKVDKPGARKKSTTAFWIVFAVGIVLGGLFHATGATLWGNVFSLVAIVSALNRFVLIPASRRFQDMFLPRLERFYHGVISFALKGLNPVFFFLGTFLLLIGSCGYFGASQPEMLLFPENYPLYVNVFIEKPIGTDIEETNEFTKKVEERITKMLLETKVDTVAYMDIVEAITTQVGQGTADPQSSEPATSSSPNKARINVSFIKFDQRQGLSTSQIMADMAAVCADIPGARITLDKDANGPPVGYPISIEVGGGDVDIQELLDVSDELRRYLVSANIKGVEELKLDIQTGKPQLLVDVDRDAAQRYGASSAQVMDALQVGLFGRPIGKYKEGEDDYDIVMRFPDESRYDLNALMNQRLTFMDQGAGLVQFPISAVADIRYSSTYGSIKRQDLDRVVTIYSNVTEGYNPVEVVANVTSRLEEYKMPSGYAYDITGEQQEQQESMSFLVTALLIAVFLIILIIVSQFNSVFVPIIIMMTVVFSTIGVLIGITVTKMPFIILMMMIGIISLAGIVVNNAIVLVDYINLLRDEKREELGLGPKDRLGYDDMIDVIVRAGEVRLRPVLLTAITTVLGLLPLAIGVNIDFYGALSEFKPGFYLGGDSVVFWAPMAWTVIFGLTFATFLTLVIVPVMFFLINRLKARTSRFFGGEGRETGRDATSQGAAPAGFSPASKDI